MHSHLSAMKNTADATSAFIAAGTVFGALPYIAAALSIAWYLLRFAEWGWRKWKHRRGWS